MGKTRMPPPPTPDEQVRFLLNVQRLLDEGLFTATYKYALLLALADIAVEGGEHDGEPLEIPIKRIAEKYITYYWRQAAPYIAPSSQPVILQQNTDRQAAVLSAVVAAQQIYPALSDLQRNKREWERLGAKVARDIVKQPLWRLQRVGNVVHDFLYTNREPGARVESITLRPGVSFCLRRFYILITQLVRFAWIAYVRKVNPTSLGTASDIEEFLFGCERRDLTGIRSVLSRLQGNRCFYCSKEIRNSAVIDHFIPWSRYPVDLGHNFVLAHESCNGAKGTFLAAEEHLRNWMNRNRESASTISQACANAGVPHDLLASTQIAVWAYEQTAAANGNVWQISREVIPLTDDWRSALQR